MSLINLNINLMNFKLYKLWAVNISIIWLILFFKLKYIFINLYILDNTTANFFEKIFAKSRYSARIKIFSIKNMAILALLARSIVIFNIKLLI